MVSATASIARPRHDVLSRVQEGLRRHLHRATQHVSYDYHEGMVLLRGNLTSFHAKQLAQEAVRRVEGVEQVVNQIRVV